MASPQIKLEGYGMDQLGTRRMIDPPKREGDCYWPRNRTVFATVLANDCLGTEVFYDFMHTFGDIKVFCKNKTEIRLVSKTRQDKKRQDKEPELYSHVYFCRFRDENGAQACLKRYEMAKLPDGVKAVEVKLAPANTEFENIGSNNSENYHGVDPVGQPRNIGPPEMKGYWPNDRNMYVTIAAAAEPDIHEVYDMMRISGEIVRFNKDPNYTAIDGVIWRGYWCCFRYKHSADESIRRYMENPIHGKWDGQSLFTDIKVYFCENYKKNMK